MKFKGKKTVVILMVCVVTFLCGCSSEPEIRTYGPEDYVKVNGSLIYVEDYENMIANKFSEDTRVTEEMGYSATLNQSNSTIQVACANYMQGQKILAVKFFVVEYDVYGEESDAYALLLDEGMECNEYMEGSMWISSVTRDCKVYVYSVLFEDGTEWGDRNAERDVIETYGLEMLVDYIN